MRKTGGSTLTHINSTVCCCPCATTGGRHVGEIADIQRLIYGVALWSPLHSGWRVGRGSVRISSSKTVRCPNNNSSMCALNICVSLAYLWCTNVKCVHKKWSWGVFGVCSDAQWSNELLSNLTSQCLHHIAQTCLAKAQRSFSNHWNLTLCLYQREKGAVQEPLVKLSIQHVFPQSS